MSDETERDDLAQALFTVREQAGDWVTGSDTMREYWRDYADKLLASAWLAQRDRKLEAATAKHAAEVVQEMRQAWPGDYRTLLRGEFTIPPVRKGGATDLFIDTTAAAILAEFKIAGESCDRGPCCLGGGHEGGCDQ